MTNQALEERVLALVDQTEKLDRLVYKLFKRVKHLEETLGIDPHEEAKAARQERQQQHEHHKV